MRFWFWNYPNEDWKRVFRFFPFIIRRFFPFIIRLWIIFIFLIWSFWGKFVFNNYWLYGRFSFVLVSRNKLCNAFSRLLWLLRFFVLDRVFWLLRLTLISSAACLCVWALISTVWVCCSSTACVCAPSTIWVCASSTACIWVFWRLFLFPDES